MPLSLKDILAEYSDLPDFFERPLRSVNDHDAYGSTPLHVAAVRGDVEAAGVLLENGALIDAQGEHGYTPLHEAAEQGNLCMIEFLCKKGASKTIVNNKGLTPGELAEMLGVESPEFEIGR